MHPPIYLLSSIEESDVVLYGYALTEDGIKTLVKNYVNSLGGSHAEVTVEIDWTPHDMNFPTVTAHILPKNRKEWDIVFCISQVPCVEKE